MTLLWFFPAQKVCLKAKYEKNVLNGTESDVLIYEKELCVKETTDCFTVNYDYNLNGGYTIYLSSSITFLNYK